jgi:aldehyde:ferredoxin oxidoreductase
MSAPVPSYHGLYLRIDLARETAESVAIAPETLRQYVGGVGLGTWILLQETDGCPDALAAEAPLVFVFSPLVGSPLTTSAKFAVVAKSPLTNRINDSLSSSHFALAGKQTGYDAIVVVERCESPSCLVIEPDGVRFVDAKAAWGHTISESETILRHKLGPQYRLALIGPAGENLVRYASLSHDRRHAGRGGHGAVMGSKNLKAIAVHGDCKVDVAHPDRLTAYARDLSKKSLGPGTEKYRELGTVSNLSTFNRLGVLPTRNFQESSFAEADQLTPEALAPNDGMIRESCAACTIRCEHVYPIAGNSTESTRSHVRMEYESLFALGPLCGIADAETVLQAAAFCDEWGLDTISAGATIAFAMECAERELIDQPGLRFGADAALLQTLESIARRDGIGELLSQGTRIASREIGQRAEEFAPHVKGLEIPGYEPRALQTMALGFAVGTRGADHNRSGAYQVDFSEAVDRTNVDVAAVPLAIETEDEAAVMDSLILCKFLRGVFDDRFAAMAEMLELVTGWDVTTEELHATARRIVNARKQYNIQQGWTPEEDTLPRRFFDEPVPSAAGNAAGLSEQRLQTLVREYNRLRGWSDEGWIPQEVRKTAEPSQSAKTGGDC